MAWETPKTDWVANPKSPVGEDFNRIEGNTAFLKDDIATKFLNVQTDIETKKGVIVDAMNDVGMGAEITDTHAELADKIRKYDSVQLLLKIFKLPNEPVGVDFGSIGIRHKTVTATGSDMYAPAGKTWIATNINNIEINALATQEGYGSSIKPPQDYPTDIIEIDLPSRRFRGEIFTSLGSNKIVAPFFTGSFIDVVNYRYYFNSGSNSMSVFRQVDYPATFPVIGDSLTSASHSLGVLGFVVNWSCITITTYSAPAAGQRIATIPQNEQWLVYAGTYEGAGTPSARGMLYANGFRLGASGIYLFGPGTVIDIKSTHASYSGQIALGIMKLKA